jgi:hypothetical protein
MMLLPLDIISQIVKYLPVADATKAIVSLCPSIETDSLKQIKNEHRDPNVFFEDIVAEVPHFMELMKMTRAMLIGIRAFSYFHHVKVKSSHPWEFMCPTDVMCWMAFIDHLEGQGVEWSSIKQSQHGLPLSAKTSSISGWLFSNGKRVPIQLTWICAGNLYMETMIDDFGMTPLQCVITGFEAVDPYGRLHSKRRYRLWEKSRYDNSEHLPDVFEAMNMCHEASIKAIGHDEHRNYDPYTRFKKYTRNYAEVDSMVVYFDTCSLLPRSIFSRTSKNIPIMDMLWEEDAYRVRALSHKATQEFSYDQLKLEWSHISLPRIDAEHARHEDNLTSSDAPSWITDPEWKIFASEIFDRELNDSESEHSDW